jgi:hypothetical protein
MPKEWERSDEQEQYLESFLEPFLQARLDKRLEPLLAKCYDGWFSRWPEAKSLWPGWQEGNALSLDQNMQLGAAIKKRQNVSLAVLIVTFFD